MAFLRVVALLGLLNSVFAQESEIVLFLKNWGGGTSGCTLAARLCGALPSATFTIFERGQDRNAADEFTTRYARSVYNALTNPGISEIMGSNSVAGLLGR